MQLNTATIDHVRTRRAQGESVRKIAVELGVAWQKLEKVTRPSAPGVPQAAGAPPDGHPPQVPGGLPGAGGRLVDLYRPRTLAELCGQPEVVAYLKAYLRGPASTALLFHGQTGTGKTAAAFALAADLGCAVNDGEFGGLHVIAAGEQSADALRQTFERLWLRPWKGGGWKVLIVNEADRMAPAVETLWLDRLENLPPRTTVVLTTNYPQRLSTRLRDRAVALPFRSAAEELTPDLDALFLKVWKARIGRDPTPAESADLKRIREASIQDGQVSFRRGLQHLEKHLLTRGARS